MTIGWAGGVGHKASLARWEPALRNVLRARPEARFVSVGHPAAAAFVEEFGAERAVAYPTRRHRGLPGDDDALRPLDRPLGREQPVPRQERPALARGERDRASRSSRTPTSTRTSRTASPACTRSTPDEVEAALLRLIDNPAERERIGRTAHEYVAEHRRIEVMAESWREVLDEVRAPVGAS